MQSFQTATDVWGFLRNRGLTITPLMNERTVPADCPQLLFWLGEQRYAIPRSHVTFMEPFGAYEPLPLAQPYVVGTARLHGHDLIILDIRPLLLQHRTTPKADALLLTIQLLDAEIALLVDSVEPEK